MPLRQGYYFLNVQNTNVHERRYYESKIRVETRHHDSVRIYTCV